jgi:hypothetical protein
MALIVLDGVAGKMSGSSAGGASTGPERTE